MSSLRQDDFRTMLSSARTVPSAHSNHSSGGADGNNTTKSTSKAKPRKKTLKFKNKNEPQEETQQDDATRAALAKYRDRAQERREKIKNPENNGKADEEEIAAHLDYEKSKYLGGDIEHTHLVKGLDFALASKVREEQQKAEQKRKQATSTQSLAGVRHGAHIALGSRFTTHLAAAIHDVINDPSHNILVGSSRVKDVGFTARQAMDERFLPGRTALEFDLGNDPDDLWGGGKLPTVITRAKEDCAEIEDGITVHCPTKLLEQISHIMSYTRKHGKHRRPKSDRALSETGSPNATSNTRQSPSSKQLNSASKQTENTMSSKSHLADDSDDIFAESGMYFEEQTSNMPTVSEIMDEDDPMHGTDFGTNFIPQEKSTSSSKNINKDATKQHTANNQKSTKAQTVEGEYDAYYPDGEGTNGVGMSTVVYDSPDEDGYDDTQALELARAAREQLKTTLQIAQQVEANDKKKRRADPKLDAQREQAKKKGRFENEFRQIENLLAEKQKKKEKEEDEGSDEETQ